MEKIRSAIGIESSSDKIFDIVGHELHGRTCYTIECGGGGYFDISFTPTMQQAIDAVKKQEKIKLDVSELLKRDDEQ